MRDEDLPYDTRDRCLSKSGIVHRYRGRLDLNVASTWSTPRLATRFVKVTKPHLLEQSDTEVLEYNTA